MAFRWVSHVLLKAPEKLIPQAFILTFRLCVSASPLMACDISKPPQLVVIGVLISINF